MAESGDDDDDDDDGDEEDDDEKEEDKDDDIGCDTISPNPIAAIFLVSQASCKETEGTKGRIFFQL